MRGRLGFFMLRGRLLLLLAVGCVTVGCASFGTGRRFRVYPNGDRVLADVPPAIQASPRHCAPATLSRALAWEGVPIPQSNLALFGGASQEKGVSVMDFYEALQPLFRDYGIVLQTHAVRTAAEALALAERHNAAARADGLPELRIPESRDALDLGVLFLGADRDCLRVASRPGRGRFLAAVETEISRGHPLLWGVILGIVPEPAESPPGGHLRLIVGYNAEERTILYSDSWGPDCPVKVMDADDAWAITMTLHSLDCSGARSIP